MVVLGACCITKPKNNNCVIMNYFFLTQENIINSKELKLGDNQLIANPLVHPFPKKLAPLSSLLPTNKRMQLFITHCLVSLVVGIFFHIVLLPYFSPQQYLASMNVCCLIKQIINFN